MIDARDVEDDGQELPSLREQIEDEEILSLFSDDPDDLRIAVRRLVTQVQENRGLEAELLDALSLAIEDACDDSQASIWMIVVAGEAGVHRGTGVLLRALAHDDETLQDAACTALLRIGSHAMSELMEWIDEDYGAHFNRVAYRLLGDTGILEDAILHARIVSFLEERWSAERRLPVAESAIEELATAFARLGHRAQLPHLRELLDTTFNGSQPVVEDAIAMLEENVAGVPFVPTIPPWEERYGWILEDDLDDARVPRPGIPESPEDLLETEHGSV